MCSERLGVSVSEAAKHIAYPTLFSLSMTLLTGTDSLAQRWNAVQRLTEQADTSEGPSPLAWPAWWGRGDKL